MLWHGTLATVGRCPLFRDEAERRALVRRVGRVLGGRAVLYGAADEHLHAVLSGDRAAVGRALSAFTRASPDEPRLAPWHIREVRGRPHLEWLVGYCTTQAEHHGVVERGALWTPTCLPDLLSARRVGFDPRLLRIELPRWAASDILDAAGLGDAPLEIGEVAGQPLGRLVATAAAALGAGPSLDGASPLHARARGLATRLALDAGYTSAQVATELGVDARSVRRLGERGVDAADVLAARRWLALEDRAAARARRAA